MEVAKWKKVKKPIFVTLGIICLFLVGSGAIYAGRNIFNDYIEKVREEERLNTIEKLKSDEQEVVVTDEITIDKHTLLQAISPAAELVTTKYYFTDADTNTKESNINLGNLTIPVPFTKDKTVFIYTGVIKVGIKDLNTIDFEIDETNKSIVVHMPKAEILDKYIDNNMEVINVKDSVFTEMSLQDYNELREKLEEAESLKLMANEEYWKYINNNCEAVIRGFIEPFAKDYTISFVWNGK